MNFMESPYPHSLRPGFWVFLQSERERHKQDINKIDKMIADLEDMEPGLKHGEMRKGLLEFSKRFVEFEL